nr:PREDICTED: protein misato homolog 1 [Daucus carota subsp. sativus]
MREIVTIQAGSFANFIGSHFWNFQDELLGLAENSQADSAFKDQCIDMDVLYRTGETQQGIDTYTPRLLAIDFKGSLGTMSSRGTLYNENQADLSNIVTWTGNVSKSVAKPQKRNLFIKSLYEEELDALHTDNNMDNGKNEHETDICDKDIVDNLDDTVKYWTDYSKVHYHPKSLYEINGLWVDSQEFNNYGIGRDAYSSGRGEEICERLRFFIEECDHIQGIQYVVDDSGGFSGVSAEFLEAMADEYTNIPVLLYTVRDPASDTNLKSRKQTVSHYVHDAVSFSRLSSFCKLIVPLGLPSLSINSRYLRINDKKPYHSSAVYASALHSVTLPFRMKPFGPTTESRYESGCLNIYESIQMLAGQSRQNKVSILDVAMPAPSLKGKEAGKLLLRNMHTLTPETATNSEDLQSTEVITLHGVLGSGHHASVAEVNDAFQAAYEHSTSPKFSHVSVSRCPLPIPLPFPSIFSNLVGQHGELLSETSSSSARGSLDVHSIPMGARLRSSSDILPFLETRLRNFRRFGVERGALGKELLRTWGFEKDDLEDLEDVLHKMVNALVPESQLSSDSE